MVSPTFHHVWPAQSGVSKFKSLRLNSRVATKIKRAYPDLKIYEGLQKPGEAEDLKGVCVRGPREK